MMTGYKLTKKANPAYGYGAPDMLKYAPKNHPAPRIKSQALPAGGSIAEAYKDGRNWKDTPEFKRMMTEARLGNEVSKRKYQAQQQAKTTQSTSSAPVMPITGFTNMPGYGALPVSPEVFNNPASVPGKMSDLPKNVVSTTGDFFSNVGYGAVEGVLRAPEIPAGIMNSDAIKAFNNAVRMEYGPNRYNPAYLNYVNSLVQNPNTPDYVLDSLSRTFSTNPNQVLGHPTADSTAPTVFAPTARTLPSTIQEGIRHVDKTKSDADMYVSQNDGWRNPMNASRNEANDWYRRHGSALTDQARDRVHEVGKAIPWTLATLPVYNAIDKPITLLLNKALASAPGAVYAVGNSVKTLAPTASKAHNWVRPFTAAARHAAKALPTVYDKYKYFRTGAKTIDDIAALAGYNPGFTLGGWAYTPQSYLNAPLYDVVQKYTGGYNPFTTKRLITAGSYVLGNSGRSNVHLPSIPRLPVRFRR